MRQANPDGLRAPPPAEGICRGCGAALREVFVDLGMVPVDGQAMQGQPLRLFTCADCRLVQSPHPAPSGTTPGVGGEQPAMAVRQIARRLLPIIGRPDLSDGAPPQAVAIGAAGELWPLDGARTGQPRAGQPGASQGDACMVGQGAFGLEAARRLRVKGCAPALILAEEGLGRAVDPHDFAAGLRALLAPGGVAAVGFPSLLRILQETAIARLSCGEPHLLCLLVAELLLGQHGLVVFDAQECGIGGTRLRLFLRHVEDRTKPVTTDVGRLRAAERAHGLEGWRAYAGFAEAVRHLKARLLDFLDAQLQAGRTVVAYGDAAAHQALLDGCGIGAERIAFLLDRGSAPFPLSIEDAARLAEHRPDFVLLLDPALREEAVARLALLRGWGGRLVLPGPELELV